MYNNSIMSRHWLGLEMALRADNVMMIITPQIAL